MDLNDFKYWINKNLDIFDVFKNWFYPQIWESIKETNGNIISGYEILKPDLIGTLNVKFEKSYLYKEKQVKIF